MLKPITKPRKLAIIGGSGLEKLVNGKVEKIESKYGQKPVRIVKGDIDGKEVVFLSRHGPHHEIPPHKINHQSNIDALIRKIGITDVVSISAVGSLGTRKILPFWGREYKVGDFVLVEDFARFNNGPTFFDGSGGFPVHADMSKTYSQNLVKDIKKAAKKANIKVKGGAVLCDVQGPRLETISEVKAYRILGIDIMGMTSTGETILINELRAQDWDVRNATLAIVTNYGPGISETEFTHEKVNAQVKQREGKVNKLIYELVNIMS